MVHSWRLSLVLLALVWIGPFHSGVIEGFARFPMPLSSGAEEGQGRPDWYLPSEMAPACAILRTRWEAWEIEGWVFTTVCLTWGISNLDSKRGFLFKGQTVLGSVYVPCISCAICFNPSTKKLWNMRRKKKTPLYKWAHFKLLKSYFPLWGLNFAPCLWKLLEAVSLETATPVVQEVSGAV